MQIQEFNLTPSKRYITILSFILVCTIGIILCLPVAIWLKITILAFIIPYGSWVMWRFGLLRDTRSVVAIKCLGEGKWMIVSQQGEVAADLSGDSTVTQLACVLRFKVPDQFWTQTCIIFPDSLSAERYQQLIVVLRMY